MIETLKKQWFVVLVAVICISFLIFCVYDTNKGKLPGKQANGKDVIATMKDYTLTADDLYPTLYENYAGKDALYSRFQVLVTDAAVKTTDELKERAKEFATSVQQQAQSQASMYGTTADAMIANSLKSLGFAEDDLEGYSLLLAKNEKLRNDYIEANIDDLYPTYYKDKKPRVVSHILINVKDVKNPTDEEKKKIEAVEKALKDGTDFAEVAKKYSDDTGSKENGGVIGYLDADNQQYVQSFVKASVALNKDGQVSEWVKESNSSYSGWHLIRADKAEQETILKDKDLKDTLYSAISSSNSDIATKIFTEAASKLDIKYANDDIEKSIKKYLGQE